MTAEATRVPNSSGPERPIACDGAIRAPAFAAAFAAALAALGLLLSGAATAQDGRAVDRAAQADLRAVGLIEFATGGGGCSGVLVRPDLVLTAAHCVPPERDGQPLAASDFVFSPSGGTGLPGAPVPVAHVLRHPLWDQLPPATRGRIRFDVALMDLARPVAPDVARPLPLADDPGRDIARGFVVSFRGGRAGGRQRQTACPVIDRTEGTLTARCEVRSGESGAPFLVPGPDGGLGIVGVAVARSDLRGTPVAVVVDLARAGGPLFDLHDRAGTEAGHRP